MRGLGAVINILFNKLTCGGRSADDPDAGVLVVVDKLIERCGEAAPAEWQCEECFAAVVLIDPIDL